MLYFVSVALVQKFWKVLQRRNLTQKEYPTDVTGLTGNITLDEFGWRKNLTVNIVEMSMNNEMVKVAEWSDSDGLQQIPPNYKRIPQNTGFENKTYIVTSILEEPYLMYKKAEDGQILEGNDMFEGYCKDLADLIADNLKFSFIIKLVNDSAYGGKDPTSPVGWNGMVGELIRKDADMGNCTVDNNIGERKRHRFYETFHVHGHQYYDQKAHE
ncbi:glutamate receptor 1 [Trichonephila clavata]|uniref:Glutamate receptor 1 n=1 Tax=Trichonephila clavata TaxID=2740835 RepID=A0A8X6GDX3_TRICU|nr:glutamate receptor 1 [Trichonephila clavata]